MVVVSNLGIETDCLCSILGGNFLIARCDKSMVKEKSGK